MLRGTNNDKVELATGFHYFVFVDAHRKNGSDTIRNGDDEVGSGDEDDVAKKKFCEEA